MNIQEEPYTTTGWFYFPAIVNLAAITTDAQISLEWGVVGYGC